MTKQAIKSATQKRSREKRDLLLAAGERSFATVGYEKTRIADLASEVGISVGVFYQRFGNKRQFFDALAEDMIQRGDKLWTEFFQSASGYSNTEDFFQRLIYLLAKQINDNIGFLRAMISLGQQDKTVPARMTSIDYMLAKSLETYLTDRGWITVTGLREHQMYFACSITIKKLLVMSLNEAGPTGVMDAKTHRELSQMLIAYLGIVQE